MEKVDYIIPIWAKTTEKDLNLSLISLIDEIEHINQIIIVHDGKDSFFLNLNYGLSTLEKKILHVYSYSNNGPGIARNYGCIFSKSDYIFFLDAGDQSISKRIQKQLPLVIENGFSYGHIREVNFNGLQCVKKSVSSYKKALSLLAYRAPFCNVTLAIKKNIFFEIKGFPPLRIAEDWVLMAKLLKNFELVSVVNEVLVTVNLGEDFIHRRRGFKKVISILKALNIINKTKIIPSYKIIFSSIIQIFLRLFPPSLLKKIYFVLRSSN